eukprot:6443481-Prymnesium_polylepis.1
MSLPQATLVLIQTLVGGPALAATPRAVADYGLLVANLLFLALTIGSILAAKVLLTTIDLDERRLVTYATITDVRIGPWLNYSHFFGVAVVLRCFGTATECLIIVGDVGTQLMTGSGSAFLTSRHTWVGIVGVCG